MIQQMNEDDRDPFHCDCGKPKSSTESMCGPCTGDPETDSQYS